MGAAAGCGRDMMHCPKCGYEQEERLDCLKCGVVFSKYYALYSATKSTASAHVEDFIPQESVDQGHMAAVSDLRLQIKELSAKLNTVEFERAERNQIQASLKNLERQFHENLERAEIRMGQFEKTLEDYSKSQIQKDVFNAHASSVLSRLEQIDSRLENLPKDPGSKIDPRILEILRKFEQRLVEFESKAAGTSEEKAENPKDITAELQDHMTVLREEVVEIKCELGLLQQRFDELYLSAQEPKTLLEEDVHAIRENLDGIRKFISASLKLQE